MKTTAAAARRLPPAPGAARVPEPAVAPAAGSALPTPPAPHPGEGGVWKRTSPAAAGHRAATRAASERSPDPPCAPRPSGALQSRQLPLPCAGDCWGGCWALGGRGYQGPTFRGAHGLRQAGLSVRREPSLRRASPPLRRTHVATATASRRIAGAGRWRVCGSL